MSWGHVCKSMEIVTGTFYHRTLLAGVGQQYQNDGM